MKISSRERRLLILLALLAAVASLRGLWLATSEPARVSAGARPSSARRGSNSSQIPGAVVIVRTDLLDPTPRPFAIGRDLFRYGAPPPPPGPTEAELEALQREAEERRRLAAEAAAAPVVPQPPAISFSFLGSFGNDETRIAVLVVTGTEEIINVRAGDVVQGAFIVDKIGFESIDIRFIGFPDIPARRLAIEG